MLPELKIIPLPVPFWVVVHRKACHPNWPKQFLRLIYPVYRNIRVVPVQAGQNTRDDNADICIQFCSCGKPVRVAARFALEDKSGRLVAILALYTVLALGTLALAVYAA